jgi:hypothetical protein
VRSWDFPARLGVVAQPWRRAGKLDISFGSCVAPLRLGGLRGKQSIPSVWLGGTGVVSTVGEKERDRARGQCLEQEKGNGMPFNFTE